MSTLRFLVTELLIWTASPLLLFGQPGDKITVQQVAIEWPNIQSKGVINVLNGNLIKIEIARGDGIVRRDSFELDTRQNVRILASFTNVHENPGSDPTLVAIRTDQNQFSFFSEM